MLLHLLEHAHLKIIPALLVLRQLQLSIHRANLELSFLARQQSQASLTRSLDPNSKRMILSAICCTTSKSNFRNFSIVRLPTPWKWKSAISQRLVNACMCHFFCTNAAIRWTKECPIINTRCLAIDVEKWEGTKSNVNRDLTIAKMEMNRLFWVKVRVTNGDLIWFRRNRVK